MKRNPKHSRIPLLVILIKKKTQSSCCAHPHSGGRRIFLLQSTDIVVQSHLRHSALENFSLSSFDHYPSINLNIVAIVVLADFHIVLINLFRISFALLASSVHHSAHFCPSPPDCLFWILCFTHSLGYHCPTQITVFGNLILAISIYFWLNLCSSKLRFLVI